MQRRRGYSPRCDVGGVEGHATEAGFCSSLRRRRGSAPPQAVGRGPWAGAAGRCRRPWAAGRGPVPQAAGRGPWAVGRGLE